MSHVVIRIHRDKNTVTKSHFTSYGMRCAETSTTIFVIRRATIQSLIHRFMEAGPTLRARSWWSCNGGWTLLVWGGPTVIGRTSTWGCILHLRRLSPVVAGEFRGLFSKMIWFYNFDHRYTHHFFGHKTPVVSLFSFSVRLSAISECAYRLCRCGYGFRNSVLFSWEFIEDVHHLYQPWREENILRTQWV